MGGKVKVICGANEVEFDELSGKSIASVYRTFKDLLSIPEDSQALVNGTPAPAEYLLQLGDTLVFAPTGWGTKGALEPDELERLIRGIDSGVKRLNEEGIFRLRLSDTEKEVFKTLFQHKTMKGEALARKVDRDYDSNFRAILSALVRHGLLDCNDEGYSVPLAVERYLKATGAVGS